MEKGEYCPQMKGDIGEKLKKDYLAAILSP